MSQFSELIKKGECKRHRGSCAPATSRFPRKARITAMDLFAGAGGFTEGAEQAGAHTLFAINHDAEAVAYHKINHPYTAHCQENVYHYNWNCAPTPDLILASPSCKCHSTAATKGGKGKRGRAPGHDELRATPIAVVNCLANQVDRGMSPILVVENVLEFRSMWRFYPEWKSMIEKLGYQASENVLCALDFGVPQRRTRLFIIFTPSSTPFDLMAPRSRRCPSSVRNLKKGDRLPFKPKIALGDRTETWFKIKDWDPSSVGKKAIVRREKLKKRLGKVPPVWYWANTDTAPLSPTEPIGTITAESGNQYYLVRGDSMRRFSVAELRGAMGFPKGYGLPSSLPLAGRLLGNAVVPQISKFIVQQLIARA